MHAKPTTAPPPTTATLQPGDLLTEREAAAILGVQVATLSNWRWHRTGPRFVKIGKRYRAMIERKAVDNFGPVAVQWTGM